jgi:outer membrane biosynthesis protein TonB
MIFMKLKTLILAGVLMFTVPCGVALAEEVSAPDPPVIEQPKIMPEAEQQLVLESVIGVPDGLTVYISIRDDVVAEVAGSQIINTTYFDSVDKAEIKIRLEGEGRLNGARFNFIPVGMPELPPLPPVLPEEEEEPIVEEPIVEEPIEEPVEEPIVEEPIVEEPIEEPVEEPIVEEPTEESTEPTEESTEELETTTPESGDPATEPTDSDPVGAGTGDAGEAVESDTGNTGEPSGESTGDSGESADTTESGDTNGSDSTGESSEESTGESSGESGE